MANVDSSTGGTLAPLDTAAPEEDADLDALFQKTVAALTGLQGQFVRPRWQPGHPKQPEPDVNWCALGITVVDADAGPAIEHLSAANGTDKYTRHEAIEVLTTFYGPRATSFASRLRDGIAIPQNMEPLKAREVGFVECGPIRNIPALINQQWVRRVDMALRFRRKVTRIYAVRNIASADIHLFDDSHVDTTIHVPSAR